MSILIKGMEMPEEGTFSIVHIYDDGHVSMPFWGKGMQIVSGITAAPVPPHGRLIDADALMKSDRKVGKLMMYGGEYVYTQAEIDRAPTIIPAEEEQR